MDYVLGKLEICAKFLVQNLEKPTWGETSDSPRHGLHVNSLLGFVY